MRNMEKGDFDIHGVGEVISSSGHDITSTALTVKEEMHSDQSSDVKLDNTIGTVLVTSNETVPCPESEKLPESANDMGTPFLFVGIKMEMPDDYESEASCENLETQYSSEEYSTNHERECKGVDECSEESSPMMQNSTSYVQVKMECEEYSEGEFDFRRNNDMSMTTDTNCAFDTRSEEQGCDMGHSSEKFINRMECLEYPILRRKEEGGHIDGQIVVNIKNSVGAEEEAVPCNVAATPFRCEYCAKGFPDRRRLYQHRRVHTAERSFLCLVCRARFSRQSALAAHARRHTGEKPFPCPLCPAPFADKASLKRHLQRHSGEKPFVCDICKAAFARKCHLQGHMLTHLGLKPHACPECGAAFASKQYVQEHMRTHTGERPFGCEFCDAAFASKNSLKKHVRIHTGEKPFSCDVCNKAFSRNGDMRRHKQIHS